MESWVFLLVGGVGAVGAALVVGTIGALVSYHRTGTMPGQPDDAPAPDASSIRALWVRVVVGASVAAAAVVTLASQGLLFAGPAT